MAKNITSVSWEASNLPSGLSFDTATGTFSGTPSVEGEFTVPVSVRTNYGEDSKDVTIRALKAYPVYAMGGMAATWSENAEPDENGFRKLNMPNAYKLLNHYGGFGAKVNGGKYYGCGLYDIDTNSNYNKGDYGSRGWVYVCSIFKNRTTPTEFTNVEGIEVGFFQKVDKFATTQHIYSEYAVMLEKRTDGKVRYVLSKLHTVTENKQSDNTWYTTHSYSGGGSGYINDADCFALDENSLIYDDIDNGISWLSDGGNKVYRYTLSQRNSESIGYRAIKKFSPIMRGNGIVTGTSVVSVAFYRNKPVFSYLSENKLLDNDASNFTYGIIRDAWIYGRTAYVVTKNNDLYEYDDSNSLWNNIGNFDAKKIEGAFMLTNDGKLYHKGSAIANVTDEHTDFTQIFPDCYFHDMTFYGTTLTVTKE